MASRDFTGRLILSRWMLSLFGVERLEQLAERLRGEEYEGLDETGIHRFHHALVGTLQHRHATFTDDVPLGYEQRIGGRGRGMGFFEAGNFYPDFVLWLVSDDLQHVAFVDPKGIRQLPQNDPKVAFPEGIRDIQNRLGDTDTRLSSFIVSNTPSATMKKMWGLDKANMEARNILFRRKTGTPTWGACWRRCSRRDDAHVTSAGSRSGG